MSRGGTPTSTLSLVRVIVLLCCAFVPEDGASGQSTSASGLVVGDYCERERFEASCAPDEVILIHWAVYGRMKLGRCVRLEYGAIKCSVNVLPLVDSRCSGRQTCKFHTSDLHTVSPCPSELVAYLEASYECIKITTCESGICEAGSFLRVPTAAGYLASSLTLSRGCGSVTCPWVLTPQPGQRFNLTFYNFPATPTELTPGQPMARGRYCQRLAVIVDKFTQVPKDVTICNEHPSPTRTIQFITTESVPVEIKIFGPISIENPTFFIVRYETIGCEDLKTPDGGWTKRDGDLLSVGCDNVQKTWHLTCDGVRWIGDIGTCDTDADKTGTNQALNAGTSLNTQSSSTHGLLLVVGIGVVLGIVLGFSMLAVAVLLLKRRRHYMAKQQLREACMTQLTGNDDLLSVNNLYNHHQGSSAMTYSDKQPVSAAAFVCPDSGLYYHTYQSRDLFAVGSSVKMAAAATSATMPSSMTSASKELPPPPPPPTTCNLEPKAITILS